MDDLGSLNSGIRLQAQKHYNPSAVKHGIIWQDTFYNKVIIQFFHGLRSLKKLWAFFLPQFGLQLGQLTFSVQEASLLCERITRSSLSNSMWMATAPQPPTPVCD